MFSELQARFYQRFTNISGESDLHITIQPECGECKMSELKKYIQGDNNGLDYVLVGDYYIPALEVTEELKACEQMH